MSALDNLKREVQENREVLQSAVALIQGLSQRIRDNVGNEAELQALADELDTQSNTLAAAVVENTPADPATSVDPEQTQG